MLRVSDLREHLRLPRTQDPDGREDDYLLGLRNAAVAYLERATNRYLGPLQEVTQLLGGTGAGSLWLPDALAVEAAAPYPEALTEYLTAGADASEITAASTDGFIIVRPDRLVRKNGGLWTAGVFYEVTYTRGYEVGGLPDSYYDDTDAARAALYAETHEAYLIGTPGDMQQGVRFLVAHWFLRRVPVAVAAGEQTEEIPFSLREILDSNRYLFV